MKSILNYLILSGICSAGVIYANTTTLCLYNSTRLTINLEFGGVSEVHSVPSLSSICKENLSKDNVEINLVGLNKGTIVSKQVDSDGLDNSRYNIPINNDLSYDLQTGNWTNSYTIFETNHPQVIATQNWMSKLDDKLKVNQIILPGSHDAGMSRTDHCTWGVKSSYAKTQKLSIFDQLNAGSRYFDIRIDYDHDQLVSFHRSGGIGCNGQTLINYGHSEGIIEDSIKFLKANKQETVFLKFSHTRDDWPHDAKDTITKIIDVLTSNTELNEYLYKVDSGLVNISETGLKAIRGKIIILLDEEFSDYINTSLGLFSYQDKEGKQFYDSPNMVVYDVYSNSSNYSIMSTDQLNKLNSYGGFGQDYLFLLSWTLTGSLGSMNIEQIANTANGHLPGVLNEKLSSINQKWPNIVYIDFINPKLAQSIIKWNYH